MTCLKMLWCAVDPYSHGQSPVLDPEVPFRVARQRVALQVDAQRVEGLVDAQPQLAWAGVEVPSDAQEPGDDTTAMRFSKTQQTWQCCPVLHTAS